MAELLLRLAPEGRFHVLVAHVEHGQREEAGRADAAFVEAWAKARRLPFVVRALDVPGGRRGGESPEAAARRLRRQALRAMAVETDATYVALGHTLDDQAETVLLRAARGTSVAGLGAMREVSDAGPWIRPLLCARRADVRAFLRTEGLTWREDETNADEAALRNRVRRELLPLFQARLGEQVPEALHRLAADARDVEAFLSEEAARALADASEPAPAGEIRLVAGRLAAYHPVVRRVALRTAYERLRGTRVDLTRDHLLRLDDHLFGSGGTSLPGGIRAACERGVLRLAADRGAASDPFGWRPAVLPEDTSLALPDIGLEVTTSVERAGDARPADDREAVFDADALTFPLRLRPWRPGDRIRPLGLHGTQKLSDLFVNRKIPREERARIPILEDGVGILWVVGVRRSDRAPVSAGTRRALRIRTRTTT